MQGKDVGDHPSSYSRRNRAGLFSFSLFTQTERPRPSPKFGARSSGLAQPTHKMLVVSKYAARIEQHSCYGRPLQVYTVKAWDPNRNGGKCGYRLSARCVPCNASSVAARLRGLERTLLTLCPLQAQLHDQELMSADKGGSSFQVTSFSSQLPYEVLSYD